MLLSLVIIGCFLLMGGFFSGSEIALISADRMTLARKEREGHRGASAALHLLSRPEWFFSLSLLGTNLSIVGSTTVATFTIMRYFGEEYSFVALFLSLVLLLMGEVVPKAVFQHYANFLAPRVAPLLNLFLKFFYPIVYVLAKTSRHLIGKAGMLEVQAPKLTRDHLKQLMKKASLKSDMKASEKQMVRRILGLENKKVSDVMRPLVEMTALPNTATLEEAWRLFQVHGFSRIPVFEGRITDIVGVFHTFDLFYAKDLHLPVTTLMRPVEYIHEHQPVSDLLFEMERRSLVVVVVVDEYGGATGIVTLEDALEEVVGEIHDEMETPEKFYAQVGPGCYEIDARVKIERLNEDLNLKIPKEGRFETLGGFLIDRFHKIPEAGACLTHEGLTFTVKEATRKSVKVVLIEVKKL